MLMWTRRLDFRKHRPKLFLQGVEKLFLNLRKVLENVSTEMPRKIFLYT